MDLLETYLDRYTQETGIPFHVSRFANGVSFLERYAPSCDLILMDIEMPLLNGMEAARRLRRMDRDVLLIFTTRMAQYAAEGYDVDAIGYLVKPIDYFSLRLKLQKAISLLEARRSVNILITDADGRHVVSSRDIFYIEVQGHSVLYHTAQGNYKSWISLKDCAAQLSDAYFELCSRYYLVNLEKVTALTEQGVRIGEETLPVSRSKRKAFLLALTGYYGGKHHGS